MESKFSLTPPALDVFEAIKQAGGHVYLVGGCVRDFLLKRRSKDIDVEVHHLSFAALKEVLSPFGTVQVMGAAFAVVHLSTLEGYEFALPRIEEKTGLKHQDFNVIVDPDLPLEKACARRDFTINSMLYDIETGTVIDFYSGQKDLKNGILRATNGNHFSEDPLRVLRGASFMSRYGFKMDPDTKNLCQSIVEEGGLDTLSTERIYTEYCKILMGLYPSQGLNFLRDIHGLPFYLQDLDTTHQRTDYHPEGSVWNHTMLVTDLAALCKHHTSEPLWFMWSALLHDIGKPLVTTPEGHAYGHAEEGAALFDEKVDLILSHKQKRYIYTMIQYHMVLPTFSRNHARKIKFLRFLKAIDQKAPLKDLLYLARCDKLGRGMVTSASINELNAYVEEMISMCGDHAPAAIVTGKDLINEGFENHQDYSKILSLAYDYQLQGLNKEVIIRRLKNETGCHCSEGCTCQ